MRYVALLRGINVGGNNRVEMSRLRTALEATGLQSVRTYINSGNIIFESPKQVKTAEVEAAIEREFGFRVATLLIEETRFRTIAQALKSTWLNDAEQRTDVLFLWDDADKPEIMSKVSFNPDIERVIYVPGALIWNIERANVMRGWGAKLIKSDIYTSTTIRNCNTVRKLLTMLA